MPLPAFLRISTLNRGSGRLQWLSTLGIRGRLLAGFITVALFTGLLGVYALDSMRVINANQSAMYTDEFTGLDVFTQYADAAYQARLRVLSYLLTTDPVQREVLHQRILAGDASITALAAQLDALDFDRQDVTSLASMTEAWDAYTRWRDNELFASGDADPARIMAAYSAKGAKLTAAFAEASDRFRAAKRASAADLAASGAAVYEQTRHLVIALSLCAVLVALGIGFVVSRSILRTVRQVGPRLASWQWGSSRTRHNGSARKPSSWTWQTTRSSSASPRPASSVTGTMEPKSCMAGLAPRPSAASATFC
jgi:methyl-accepting chemotaxis protein